MADFDVEKSKAARIQKLEARKRNRGGLFVAPTHNPLLALIKARNLKITSPRKPRASLAVKAWNEAQPSEKPIGQEGNEEVEKKPKPKATRRKAATVSKNLRKKRATKKSATKDVKEDGMASVPAVQTADSSIISKVNNVSSSSDTQKLEPEAESFKIKPFDAIPATRPSEFQLGCDEGESSAKSVANVQDPKKRHREDDDSPASSKFDDGPRKPSKVQRIDKTRRNNGGHDGGKYCPQTQSTGLSNTTTSMPARSSAPPPNKKAQVGSASCDVLKADKLDSDKCVSKPTRSMTASKAKAKATVPSSRTERRREGGEKAPDNPPEESDHVPSPKKRAKSDKDKRSMPPKEELPQAVQDAQRGPDHPVDKQTSRSKAKSTPDEGEPEKKVVKAKRQDKSEKAIRNGRSVKPRSESPAQLVENIACQVHDEDGKEVSSLKAGKERQKKKAHSSSPSVHQVENPELLHATSHGPAKRKDTDRPILPSSPQVLKATKSKGSYPSRQGDEESALPHRKPVRRKPCSPGPALETLKPETDVKKTKHPPKKSVSLKSRRPPPLRYSRSTRSSSPLVVDDDDSDPIDFLS